MAIDPGTAARPYAKAAYEYAAEQKTVKDWSHKLAALLDLLSDPQVERLCRDVRCPTSGLAEFVIAALGLSPGDAFANFVRVLADNRRLLLVRLIGNLFEARLTRAAGKVKVQVVSAGKFDLKQQAAFTKALKKRLGKEVVLDCTVDETLLGGGVVKIDDIVLDGSLKTRLANLRSAMIS